MKNYIFAATVSSAITIFAVSALAHSGATGIVKERMDGMAAMADVVKQVSAMMRGDTTYDAAAVKAGAEVLKAHSGEAMTKLFPEGSNKMPSVARDEIWSEWESFEEIAGQLSSYAEGLALASENGVAMGNTSGSTTMMGTGTMMGATDMPEMTTEQLAAMPVDGVFNMVTQTCSTCHTKFRIEKK